MIVLFRQEFPVCQLQLEAIANLSFPFDHLRSLHRARPPLFHLDVCDERVLTSPKAGNIGVIFDEYLSMLPQVTAMCKSAFYHLRKISLIRKHLTFDEAQLLVPTLITSKLDYCNSLLYGLPKHVTIKQLQHVQNAASRIFSLTQVLSYYTCSYESPVAPN